MNLILEDNVQNGCFGFRSAIHLHPQEDDKQYSQKKNQEHYALQVWCRWRGRFPPLDGRNLSHCLWKVGNSIATVITELNISDDIDCVFQIPLG